MGGKPARRQLNCEVRGDIFASVHWNGKKHVSKTGFDIGGDPVEETKEMKKAKDITQKMADDEVQERKPGKVFPVTFFACFGSDDVEKDDLKVRFSVVIHGITDNDVQSFNKFDDEKDTDLTIIVGIRKFFVVRKDLSEAWKKLAEIIEKSKTPRTIRINFVDSGDFQTFLEVLHDYSPLRKSNVESVLLIATDQEVPPVIEACENFIMRHEFPIEKVKQMAEQYSSERLQKFCDEFRAKLESNASGANEAI